MRVSDWSSDVCSSDRNEDVRYLGRLLGDVIRAYGGEELCHRTEYIRRASVDRHRGISGADAVDTGLDRLSLDDTLSFVRGFMLFSMLANLAEDRHSRASQHWPSLASALDILDKQGVARAEVIRLLDNGLIRPVLTAHPTEVDRKSTRLNSSH